MKRTLILFFILISGITFAQPQFSGISSKPGAFSRMGFGARGIGMGNALSSVTEGNLVSYYNPAVSSFQNGNSFQTSYSFLSLDRSLNFLNFTRRFDFYSSKDTTQNQKPTSSAGVSIGVINSGVGKIDGRDNQGNQTGELSTSENQFFLGLSNKFSDHFSLGIAVKFYYYKLYEDITTNSLGIDIGALYSFNDKWNVSLVISDLNSKYEWNTTSIYEQEGTISEDSFPMLRKIGLSYFDEEFGLLASVEFESSDAETNIIRLGGEYNLIENLYLRAGIDQYNLSNSDFPVRPSAGFSYSKDFNGWIVGVDYAFVLEQYSPYDRHIVGINIRF